MGISLRGRGGGKGGWGKGGWVHRDMTHCGDAFVLKGLTANNERLYGEWEFR